MEGINRIRHGANLKTQKNTAKDRNNPNKRSVVKSVENRLNNSHFYDVIESFLKI